MKTLIIIIVSVFLNFELFAQTDKLKGIYVKTFGDVKNAALIFVHGGPDYNSYDFELTTAPALASRGFYVVVYDQRGQGRSAVTDSTKYNYEQYSDDIKNIILKFKLKEVSLIGHSHGGVISIQTHKKNPNLIKKVILLSSPVNWMALSDSVVENCTRSYTIEGNLNYLEGLKKTAESFENFDSLTFKQKVGATSWIFIHAGSCGAYNLSNPTESFLNFQKLLASKPIENVIIANSQKPMPFFLKNENYIRRNMIEYVKENQDAFCGIYGDEDGLFNKRSLEEIQNVLDPKKTKNNFRIIKGSSHYIYYQKQEDFFDSLSSTCGL